MELPFYLRILPPEALEVLAYYRRLDHTIAYANSMITATGLSERGFGKAIRRLVTKGYLVLDGDQRYRLTEHGQRAVDDLPDSMGVRGELSSVQDDVEHVPVDNTDTFESLFTESTVIDTVDPLFDDPVSDVDAASFLTGSRYDDEDAFSRLFDGDESEEDDLFAEMNEEDAAAFNELFGDADEDESPAATPEATEEAGLVTADTEAEDDTTTSEPEDAPIIAAAEPPESIALEDLFSGMNEALPAATLSQSSTTEPEFHFAEDSASSDDLFEWLELDGSPVDDQTELWGELEIATESAPAAASDTHIVERRLLVALPQPLVAGQPAHITIAILPDESATLAAPVELRVRLAVLNGEPAQAQDFPLLLGNGLARQDVVVTPGRYRQARLRVRIYQHSDDADEAILCGGLYVDADIVADADSRQTPVAFGANTHFVLTP